MTQDTIEATVDMAEAENREADREAENKEAETEAENKEADTVIDDKTEKKADSPEESPAYRKAYLIDSENISDEWVDLLDTIEGQDAIFVFYTAKSTHINCERVYKLMQHGIGRVQWIRCFEGNNALDFQLVTELGAMIGRKKAAEYIIVSKDNGYNSVVRYWNDRGITVTKTGTKAEKTTAKEPDKRAEKAAELLRIETMGKAAPEQSGKAPSGGDFLRGLLKSVDIMDNSLLYGSLAAFEGVPAGAETYRRLRDLPEEEKLTLRGLLLEDKYERGVNYLRLLALRNDKAPEDAEGLYETILKGPKKNKDKYRKALAEKYGKEPGEDYYRLTKSHYNFIKKI